MATVTGQDGQVSIGGTSVENVTSWTLDMSADTVEASVMGNSSRVYKSGLSSFTGSFDVLVDEAAAAGQDSAIMRGMDGDTTTGDGAALAFVFTTSTGGKTYSGNGHITGKSISAEMEGMVSMSVTFQGTGSVTETPAA